MITKTCTVSGQTFEITDKDLKFYEKMGVPSPTLCPEERMRKKFVWRNERGLHYRNCDATGERILSMFPQESDIPVYNNDYWWSDHWDAFDYALDFNFTKPFFPQIQTLYNQVPQSALATIHITMENAHFCNCAGHLKNCYMLVNSDYSENCYHGKAMNRCFDCIDSFKIMDSEACYEVCNSENCSFCTYLYDSRNCNECHFSRNLVGCQDCFGCTNLNNKRFYFMNQSYDEQTYQKKVSNLRNQYSNIDILKYFRDFQINAPVRFMEGLQNQDVSGNYLNFCKNAIKCFDSQGLEDCKFCWDIKKVKIPSFGNYDVCFFGEGIQNCYECSVTGDNSEHLKFCAESFTGASDLTYCVSCRNGVDELFGCVGLKKQKHCILNKSYTTHEYETLKTKIIAHMKETGEWGEFFPISMSPFAYNETVAQEYFPLTREEALARGYGWREEKELSPDSQGVRTGNTTPVPDNITQVPDNITDQVLYCKQSGKPYKIQKAELKFYRKMNLPIPRLHPDIRHQERMKLRNPRQLWSRACGECQKDIQTTYAHDRPEKVLCEGCYLKVVD